MGSSEEALRVALQHRRRGRHEEARAVYQQILRDDPRNALALNYMGLLARQKRDYKAAADWLQKAVAADPVSPEYKNNLATTLGMLGRSDEALELLDQAIALKPHYPEAYNNRGLALADLKRMDQAIASLQHAIELQPRYAEAQYNLGNILRQHGQYPQSIAAFRKLIDSNPNRPKAHNSLGVTLQEAGYPTQAAASLRQAIHLRPGFVEAHWNLACALLLTGDFEQGWLEYEWRQRLKEDTPQHRDFPQPVWNGAPITGGDFTITASAMDEDGNWQDADEVIVHIAGARLHTVMYSGDAYHPVTRDPAPSLPAYSGAHWQDDNYDGDTDDVGEHDWPVCYTRSSSNGGVFITVAAGVTTWGNLGQQATLKASGSIGSQELHFSQVGSASGSGGSIGATLRSEEAIPNTVHRGWVPLDWEISFDGGPWKKIGSTSTLAYLTWDDPIPFPLYETCVRIGCDAAAGDGDATPKATVVNHIWGAFTGLSVERMDGTVLEYSHLNDSGFDTASLLQNGYGRCGAWGKFLVDTLGAQGISAVTVKITADTSVLPPPPPPPEGYGYNRTQILVNTSAAQGIFWPYPCTRFDDHCVVRVVGDLNTIFDPSYGMKYTGSSPSAAEQAWQDEAFAGFVFVYKNIVWQDVETTLPGGSHTDGVDEANFTSNY